MKQESYWPAKCTSPPRSWPWIVKGSRKYSSLSGRRHAFFLRILREHMEVMSTSNFAANALEQAAETNTGYDVVHATKAMTTLLESERLNSSEKSFHC